MKVLNMSTFLGGQSNADNLQYIISVIESFNWKTVPVAENRRPKSWRRLFSRSLGLLKAAGDFV